MKKILFLIAALAPLSAQAWWFGNYDDCVLDNMKAGLSNGGVAAVKTACRNKYPSKTVETNLTDKHDNPFLASYYKTIANGTYKSDSTSSCGAINLTNEEIGNIKLQPDNHFYSIWNGNNFKINDLAFTLKFKEKDYLGTVVANNEVNKSAGSVDSESSQSTISLNFPSNIYSYTVIKATKLNCK
ncbi:MAG: hypothetical protein PHY16_02535 [Methylobacter sp.]|nr:hypothetical protein [Methylobacter sp.]